MPAKWPFLPALQPAYTSASLSGARQAGSVVNLVQPP